MIQMQFLHQMYFTPLCLFRIGRRESPVCHKCNTAEGLSIHMVWYCDKVRPFWSQVTYFIADSFDLPNICSPERCLLGLIDYEELETATKLFFHLLYCYARKVIVIQWIRSDRVGIKVWKKRIKLDLPFYRMTYEAQVCPKKCNKIWSRWIDSQDTLVAN